MRTAFIQDDGGSVSLILLPSQTASFGAKPEFRALSVTLYRHKWPMISKFFYLLGKRDTRDGGAEQFRREFLKNRPISRDGVFKKSFCQLVHRRFVLSSFRGEKEMLFSEPPEFSLLWADSGESVAALLNGEPWAFVLETTNRGYSKGVLRSKNGNAWDQELFEKIFLEKK